MKGLIDRGIKAYLASPPGFKVFVLIVAILGVVAALVS